MNHIPLLFGRFLVKAGWVTEAQLHQAVRLQQELTCGPGLAAVLEGVLTVDALRRVLAHQRQTGLLWHDAIRALGLLDAEQLAGLDTHCSTQHVILGEALVLQGSLSAEALQEALESFKHYNTTGILVPHVHPDRLVPEEVNGPWVVGNGSQSGG
jgi:hypothetical protein